ncbi:metallophosphoesterase [Metabacillus halosaccharovorans]|uniref:metallophosphoesterase n=1 Tax=Metabacillus halosaccharovorans TaxID=930124 RepID=UPI00099542C4|nr:metallophosphoesterase [Metabacillus halosaccharovorans]
MNKLKRVLLFIVIVFMILVIYTIWDNNRVIIVEEDILVEDLPVEFEEFKILQVTDLHEKEFGKNQKELINKINSVRYDVLSLTGDYLKSQDSENYSATYKILDGIRNKEHVLYVPGNTDPAPYVIKNKTVVRNPFLLGLEKRGVKLLESDYKINHNGVAVQFVNFEESILEKDEENNSSVLIALNHYPIVDTRIDQIRENPNQHIRNYDLIMAGHYHGGQIRLPFVGALFVPEAWYERSGLFPPQDRVKGLWQYNHTKQYVSAGLGSSNAIPFLNFRFLNTPEINVLTLRRK